ncbi:hypothetical protein CEP54_010934 [Fusarium duplospermum]|uniref:Uncharacterized protein n=1 Tax=Fusarium duplospermum TaxID=1325734 RepID=A0A428PH89_9HYPO|nr:hypothetical protein CEP54_010934 [Fusarium duplospermum]
MSQNSTNNTVARGNAPKETHQSSAQGAAPNTNNETGSTNTGRSLHHTRRCDPRDLIIVEAETSDKPPREEPVMVHRTRPRGRRVSPSDLASIDFSDLIQEEPVMVSQEEAIDDEWIKEFPKDSQKEADNAQGSRE